jgi:hypothetical protein
MQRLGVRDPTASSKSIDHRNERTEQTADQRPAVGPINKTPEPSTKPLDGAFYIFANCADVSGATITLPRHYGPTRRMAA